jgi:hypothetical protein
LKLAFVGIVLVLHWQHVVGGHGLLACLCGHPPLWLSRGSTLDPPCKQELAGVDMGAAWFFLVCKVFEGLAVTWRKIS